MNKFKKYCPNVWVAECNEEYERGETIELETKYGKTVECEVYNLVAKKDGNFYYSIERLEDQTYAQRKAERYSNAAKNHTIKKYGTPKCLAGGQGIFIARRTNKSWAPQRKKCIVL